MKTPYVERLHAVTIKLTLEEHVAIREAARLSNIAMGTYARRVLLPQAQQDAGDTRHIVEAIIKRQAEESAMQSPYSTEDFPLWFD